MKSFIDYESQADAWDEKTLNVKDDIQSGMFISNSFIAQYRKFAEEKHFQKFVKLDKNMKVLELACGTGRWSFFIAPFVKRVLAIDISLKMIEIAKRKKELKNVSNIHFVAANALNIELKEKYDVIYLSCLLQYIDGNDIEKIITKVRKYIRKDGIVISRDTISLKNKVKRKNEGVQTIYRTEDEYVDLFKQFGFELIYKKLTWFRPFFTFSVRKHFIKNMSLKTAKVLSKFTFVFDKLFILTFRRNNFSHNFYCYRLLK